MVDNPIYVESNSEVPIYDTVHSKVITSDAQIDQQYEILLPDPRSCTASTDLDLNTTLNTEHYIPQPIQNEKTKVLGANVLAESTLKDIDSKKVQDNTYTSPGPSCENMRTGFISDTAISSQPTATSNMQVFPQQSGGKTQRSLELSYSSSSCPTEGDGFSPDAIDAPIASSSENTPMNQVGIGM